MAVTHSNLTTHSAPFALPSGIHQVFVTGTVADGADQPSLQVQANGAYVNLDPPIKWAAHDIGGTKTTKMISGGQYRWTIPPAGPSPHNISTSITKVA
jgi:hypothetical protein